MALLQVVWVTMPLILALLQCRKPLFVLTTPILNGMLGTICLGHVEIWCGEFGYLSDEEK
jgi:hypothetical protein